MASLESIRHVPRRGEVCGGNVQWVDVKGRKVIEALPQIVWENGRTWSEANLWALEQATTHKKRLNTVLSAMTGLCAYAKWLEQEGISWWHFPACEADRCLNRYRGVLIEARDFGQLAPSTASARMAVVVRFYRWLSARKLLSPEWPMWNERLVGIRLADPFGFQHTLNVNSTDLAIPNRKAQGEMLEDGLLPVSADAVAVILEFAESEASEELALMLRLGFLTGMRLGTIADLRLETIDSAVPDIALRGWFRLAIGPGAHPPVHTKLGVTGQAFIPEALLEKVRTYAYSVRRLKRQALASAPHRKHVFLTRFGTPYRDGSGSDKSRAVNVEMGRLRTNGIAAGIYALHNFHFHRTRCTFATELARVAIRHLSLGDALNLVREALLHKHEATTLKYIKFVQKTVAMAEASDAFTEALMGLGSRKDKRCE